MAKSKLKIAMVNSYDAMHAGGVPHHIEALSKELEKRGHEVHVFGTRNTKFTFTNYHEVAQSTLFMMPGGGRGAVATALPDINISDIIKKGKFDICHIHDPFVPFISWDIANNLSIKKVCTFHTCWNDSSFYQNLRFGISLAADYYAQRIDGSIYVSKMAKRCWSSLGGKVPQVIISNGVSDDYVPAEKKNKKTIDLLFIGRIIPRKGLLYLLKAVGKLHSKYPEIRLTVIGEGPDLQEAKIYIRENELQPFVKIKGEVMGQEKIEYLQQADIFCAPYRNEAFGMTILEALACGCPVAGYWESGYSDYLNKYPNRERVFPKRKTADDLANAIKFLIEHPDERQKASVAGVSIGSHYRWSKVAEETETFYRSL